ncbi:glycosyltransferase [Metabacillus halosaccharovorans]|uniref:glycosyltransferase n=1 Tax=Metabacillus halosaccharovorans TaxID=930124 RepID=UPI0034CDE2A9
MRVLWITTQYPSDIAPGAGVFHKTQIDALVKLGVEVTVITPVPKLPRIFELNKRYKLNNQKNEQFPRNEKVNGVDVYRPLYTALPGQLKWAQPHRRIAKAIKNLVKQENLQFDLIHSHFAMPSGGAGNILSKTFGKPYMITLHGSDVNVYPHYSSFAMKAFKTAVLNAADLVAVSKKLALKTNELTDREPVFLPIGINLSTFNFGRDHAVSDIDIPKNKIILTYIGRLVKEKGIIELTEALKNLDDRFYCIFIGDGPLKGQLENDKDLKGKIMLTGQVPNEMVTTYLSKADIFILPSYSEGMPTVIIEALALKKPVISTNVGGVPELFGKYSNILIEPKSSQQIKDTVLAYIDGSTYSEDTIEDLYDKVIKEYDAETNAKKLKELYEKH